MTNTIKVSASTQHLKGEITLTGSKSIANRVLLIRALTEEDFEISNMSESDDSKAMNALLGSDDYELDAHHAGTTYRFLTAYLAIQGKERVLTGSERMKQRPIGPLVDALRSLGCSINYLGNEGYPPLKIGAPASELKDSVSVPGNISSQYLSALLMIAPALPNGLTLHILEELVSKPYLEMTLGIMGYFGVKHTWIDDHTINVPHQKYIAKDFFVEADWSAASYYYSLAALSEEADITLVGLNEESLQGDAAIAKIAEQFGVNSVFEGNKVHISKKKGAESQPMIEYDFIKQPDIAQTVFAMCAGTGTQGLFTGLQTLYIKETNRIAAFQAELAKVGVALSKLPARFIDSSNGEYFMVDGTASVDSPTFDTYQDHRMAMALAPLALKGEILINEPHVVSKSYPAYWEDLAKLGFEILPKN